MQRTITQTLRLTIGISFFAFILIGINDGAVGVLLPGMQTTYHVGKDTLSLLFLAGTLGYLTASFNNGLFFAREKWTNFYTKSLPTDQSIKTIFESKSKPLCNRKRGHLCFR